MLKRTLLRLLVCFSATLTLLLAQNPATPDPKLPPAMQQALDRILKQQPNPVDFRSAAPATTSTSVCSVPLIETHIDHPERFRMPQATAAPIHDSIDTAPMPAPPCQPKTP